MTLLIIHQLEDIQRGPFIRRNSGWANVKRKKMVADPLDCWIETMRLSFLLNPNEDEKNWQEGWKKNKCVIIEMTCQQQGRRLSFFVSSHLKAFDDTKGRYFHRSHWKTPSKHWRHPPKVFVDSVIMQADWQHVNHPLISSRATMKMKTSWFK